MGGTSLTSSLLVIIYAEVAEVTLPPFLTEVDFELSLL